MKPGEKVDLIDGISEKLGQLEFNRINLTLKQFRLSWDDSYYGTNEDYVISMLENAEASSLLELGEYLGIQTKAEATPSASFWSESQPRVFISHITRKKGFASKLGDQLKAFGVSSFVAHVDIEPTKEWMAEIERALLTMDAMVVILKQGFKESEWTDQEVGAAVIRRVPIVPVKFEFNPYGFMGKFQALNGNSQSTMELADQIIDILISKTVIGNKIVDAIVNEFATSRTFDDALENMERIRKCPRLTQSHIATLRNSVKSNKQIRNAWGVPEKLKEFIKNV